MQNSRFVTTLQCVIFSLLAFVVVVAQSDCVDSRLCNYLQLRPCLLATIVCFFALDRGGILDRTARLRIFHFFSFFFPIFAPVSETHHSVVRSQTAPIFSNLIENGHLHRITERLSELLAPLSHTVAYRAFLAPFCVVPCPITPIFYPYITNIFSDISNISHAAYWAATAA